MPTSHGRWLVAVGGVEPASASGMRVAAQVRVGYQKIVRPTGANWMPNPKERVVKVVFSHPNIVTIPLFIYIHLIYILYICNHVPHLPCFYNIAPACFCRTCSLLGSSSSCLGWMYLSLALFGPRAIRYSLSSVLVWRHGPLKIEEFRRTDARGRHLWKLFSCVCLS